MTAVTVRRVSKQFGQTPVLRGVDIAVPDGAFAVLVGPSGCGKSTLLRVLAGLETCDAGEVRFGERDVTVLPPRERDVAMVFQSYALYPHLDVRQNLAFGLELKRTAKDEIARRIEEVSRVLGLHALLDRYPRQLSGGQRQRVAMGRAIVRRPALFLFDEPLSNLDASLRAQVRVEIKRLHERFGTTSVYVTHDQVEAMTLADVMFVMRDGQVEQSGAPLEVYSRPATRFVAAFLGSPSMNFVDAKLAKDGEGWYAEAPGLRLRVAAAALGTCALPAAGRSVVAGVRPHDVTLATAGAVPALELVVEVVEALGSESVVHGRLGGAEFVARLDGTARVSAGNRLLLDVAPEAIHVFDPETGKALFVGG